MNKNDDNIMYSILKDKKFWKRFACIIAIIGIVQYIIITTIGMIFFPDGFSIVDNYFSHLGMTIAKGLPNTISRIMFVTACVIMGVLLIPFWLIIPTLFRQTKTMKCISYFGTFFGLLSSPFLMALAIIPLDIFLIAHGFSAMCFFLFFSLAIFIYSFAIFLNQKYKNKYALISFIFSIIAFLYTFQLYPNYINISSKNLYIYPSIQKLVFYCYCIWVIFQVSKIWNNEKKKMHEKKYE